MVKCYINAYKDTEFTIKSVIDKIMGESEFKGTQMKMFGVTMDKTIII